MHVIDSLTFVLIMVIKLLLIELTANVSRRENILWMMMTFSLLNPSLPAECTMENIGRN